MYNAFVKYYREVNSGRRELENLGTLNLGNILELVCGIDEKLPLGFVKSPEIHFFEVCESFLLGTLNLGNILELVCGIDEKLPLGFVRSPEIHFFEVCESFLPTANTCSQPSMCKYQQQSSLS